jgi:hypothetical protein
MTTPRLPMRFVSVGWLVAARVRAARKLTVHDLIGLAQAAIEFCPDDPRALAAVLRFQADLATEPGPVAAERFCAFLFRGVEVQP